SPEDRAPSRGCGSCDPPTDARDRIHARRRHLAGFVRPPGPERSMPVTVARSTTAGVVSAGHPATVAAAIGVLGAGGNAYDAAVAAGFAASVAEPCLSSLGGGGFLLARTASGRGGTSGEEMV